MNRGGTTGWAVIAFLALTTACTPMTPTPTPPTTGATGVSSSAVTSTATPGPSVSGTATTPAGPTIPPAAQANTIDGAQEFVRFYFATLNEASRSAQPSLLDPLISASCAGCQAGRALIQRWADADKRTAGDVVRPRFIVLTNGGADSATVLASYEQLPVALVDGLGQTVDRVASAKAESTFTLAFGQTWRIERMQTTGG